MRRLLLVLLLALAPLPAFSQGAVQQSGPVTPFHIPGWFYNGVIADGGMPSAPYINALGMFNGSNCPFGISSQTSPGTPTGQWSQFSVCQTNTTTTFNFNGFGGLGAPALQFSFNGTIYPFPFSPGSTNDTVTLISVTGTSYLSAFGQTVAVSTLATAPVFIVLPAAASFSQCPGTALSCPVISIKDVAGNAATGLIFVTTADGKTIDGQNTYYLAFTLQAATFELIGNSWIVR